MFPTAADWARLDEQFPILDGSSPELQAIAERYNLHTHVLEQCCYSQDLLLLPVPEDIEMTDLYYVDHDSDRENTIQINKQISCISLRCLELYLATTLFTEKAHHSRDYSSRRWIS